MVTTTRNTARERLLLYAVAVFVLVPVIILAARMVEGISVGALSAVEDHNREVQELLKETTR